MATLNFDATTVPPETGFEPVPDGEYLALITDSELKPTKNGQGMYLQLVWQIVDGPFQSRKVWDRLNVRNANKMAEEIAHKQLSAVCHAVGVLQVRDSADLHNKPARIRVIKKAADPGYQPSNEVKGYSSVGSATVQAPPPASATAQQPMFNAPQSTAPAAAQTAARTTPPRDAPKPPWAK